MSYVDVTEIFPLHPEGVIVDTAQGKRVYVPAVTYVSSIGSAFLTPIPNGAVKMDLSYFTPGGEHAGDWMDDVPSLPGVKNRWLIMPNGDALEPGQWNILTSNFTLPPNPTIIFQLAMANRVPEETEGEGEGEPQPETRDFQGVVVDFGRNERRYIRLWFAIEGGIAVEYCDNVLTSGQAVYVQLGGAGSYYAELPALMSINRGEARGVRMMVQIMKTVGGIAITTNWWRNCILINLPLESNDDFAPPHLWGIPWQIPASPITFMGNCGIWALSYFPTWMPREGGTINGPVRNCAYNWVNNPNPWEFRSLIMVPTEGGSITVSPCFDNSGNPIPGRATIPSVDGGSPDERWRFEWQACLTPAEWTYGETQQFKTYTSPHLLSVTAYKRAYVEQNTSTYRDITADVKSINIDAAESGAVTGEVEIDRKPWEAMLSNWTRYRRRTAQLALWWTDPQGNPVGLVPEGQYDFGGMASRPQATTGRGTSPILSFPIADYLSALGSDNRVIDIPPGDAWPLKDYLEYILQSAGIGPALYTSEDVDKGLEDLGIVIPAGDLTAPAFKGSAEATVAGLVDSLRLIGLGARLWVNGGIVTWSCQYCGYKRSPDPEDPHFWYNHISGGYRSPGCLEFDKLRGTLYEPGDGYTYGYDIAVFLGIKNAPLSRTTSGLYGDALEPLALPELDTEENIYSTIKTYGQSYYLGQAGQREIREYTVVATKWDALNNPYSADYTGQDKIFAIGPAAWLKDPRWIRAITLMEYYRRCFSWQRLNVTIPFWPGAKVGRVFLVHGGKDLGLDGTLWRVIRYRHTLRAGAKDVRSYAATQLTGVKIGPLTS